VTILSGLRGRAEPQTGIAAVLESGSEARDGRGPECLRSEDSLYEGLRSTALGEIRLGTSARVNEVSETA
jgi:hypothetical protein